MNSAICYWRAGKYLIPQGIIDRPPTAEPTFNQKDTDSLPPYPVLDPILRDYVYVDNVVPANLQQTVAVVRKQMPMIIPANFITNSVNNKFIDIFPYELYTGKKGGNYQ